MTWRTTWEHIYLHIISTGRFVRSDAKFSFPYGFKHGTVMPITDEEYDRIKAHYNKQ